MNTVETYDVIIVGGGAAGLMCAIEAGKRGRKTLLVDHAAKMAEKIRISGGGRCNFTNINADPRKHYISNNPHFCISALKRYTPWDFIDLMVRYDLSYHEKKLGQLFCDQKSNGIIQMLLDEARAANVKLKTDTKVSQIIALPNDQGFKMLLNDSPVQCQSLVMASGGKSIPKMGATGFAYKVATDFGLTIIQTEPALVPFMVDESIKDRHKNLSGLAVDAVVSCNKARFEEAILFTHRGLSGPAILQISSYWNEGDTVTINLLPSLDLMDIFTELKKDGSPKSVGGLLKDHLPNKLVDDIDPELPFDFAANVAETSDKNLQKLADRIHRWAFKPIATEGYRTAEVTRGGIDTTGLSSKTFEANTQKGLYFIGECLDVTGHLGGFNFQWAWASGHACGQVC